MDEKEFETKMAEYKYHILTTYIKNQKYLTQSDIIAFINILEQEQGENEQSELNR